MGRGWYYANAALYAVNSALWAWYAHKPLVAVIFAAVTVGAVVMARRADTWRYS